MCVHVCASEWRCAHVPIKIVLVVFEAACLHVASSLMLASQHARRERVVRHKRHAVLAQEWNEVGFHTAIYRVVPATGTHVRGCVDVFACVRAPARVHVRVE